MSSDAAPARHLTLDILRILASLMVVMMHVAPQNWGALDADSTAINFYDSIARGAVPLFFMISGLLFLSRDGGVQLGKLYRSNILRLVSVYAVWTLFYALVPIFEHHGGFSLSAPQFLWLVIEGVLNPKYHLWFLPAMILVYVLMPALYAIARYKEGKYLLYTCVSLLGIYVIVQSFFLIPPMSSSIPEILGRSVAWVPGYSGYFLLGYYFSKKDLSKLKTGWLLVAAAMVFLFSFGLATVYSLFFGSPLEPFFENFALPVVLMSTLLFVTFLKLGPTVQARTSGNMSKLILLVSGASLAIYMIHPFIIEHTFAWLDLEVLAFTKWLAVPVRALAIFALSLIAGIILKKIPFVKKWFV